MWYEQLWSGFAVWGFLTAACYMSGPFNYLDTGRWYRRNVLTPKRQWMHKRDHRLTGNMYIVNGLDTIKD